MQYWLESKETLWTASFVFNIVQVEWAAGIGNTVMGMDFTRQGQIFHVSVYVYVKKLFFPPE